MISDGIVKVEDIKKMLEVFGFKTSLQDIKNVLKQGNLGEAGLSFKEFKLFFNKIINEE